MLQELWLKVEEIFLVVFRAFQELPSLKRTILAVGLIAIIPSYFVTKYVSYGFWNFQYRNEYIAARPSFEQSQDVVVGKAHVLSTGANSYTAYAELENKNLDLAFNKAAYEFTFFNKEGAQVASSRGSLFMLPNSAKYIVVPRVISEDPIVSASVTVNDVRWQKKALIPEITLRTPEPATYTSLNPLEFVAEGIVVNNSAYRLGQVRLVFLLYGKSGEIIGVSSRSEFTVLPSERRAYVQRWPNIYQDEVAKLEVFAETNALDGNNLILQDLPGGNLDRLEANPFY